MVSSQLHYTKVNRFMPFLLAEILNFQGSIHRIGVGSFSQLKDSTFLRCHQSFFVNLSKTMGMKADGFIMKDITVPISRTYLKESQRQYREYLNQKDMVIE